jgi:hypothetical protein
MVDPKKSVFRKKKKDTIYFIARGPRRPVKLLTLAQLNPLSLTADTCHNFFCATRPTHPIPANQQHRNSVTSLPASLQLRESRAFEVLANTLRYSPGRDEYDVRYSAVLAGL